MNLKYADLKAASTESPLNVLHRFIEENLLIYKDVLDKNFSQELELNLPDRYWELLFCCLLKENCRATIKKPACKAGTACYDFDVEINNNNFAIENTCINLDLDLDLDLDSKISPGLKEAINGSEISSLLQLRITSAITGNKKSQYEKILKAGNIDEKKPYVLAVGLYGSIPAAMIFLNCPTDYLGAVLPAGSPLFYFDEPNLIKENLPTAQYSEFNTKENGALVSKNIFIHPDYSFISAILFSGFSDQKMIKTGQFELTNDLILIHNPLAKNKLTEKLLPVSAEYVVTFHEMDLIKCNNIIIEN